MAKSKPPPLRYDKFVEVLRPDPKSTPKLVVLEGYVGQSSEDGNFRLYSDDALCNYIEIPINAVLHAEANTSEQNPLGGSKIWVKADTVYTAGPADAEVREKGTFLQGSLYNRYTGRIPGAGQVNIPSFRPGCTINVIDCLPHSEACPSEYMTACVSKLYLCPVSINPRCFADYYSRQCFYQLRQAAPQSVQFCGTPDILPPQSLAVPCDETVFINCQRTVSPKECPNGRTCRETCQGPYCLVNTDIKTCKPQPTKEPECTLNPEICRTCVRTCNEPDCLRPSDPRTCIVGTVPGGPACRVEAGGSNYRTPGYGYGTFNPYQY